MFFNSPHGVLPLSSIHQHVGKLPNIQQYDVDKHPLSFSPKVFRKQIKKTRIKSLHKKYISLYLPKPSSKQNDNIPVLRDLSRLLFKTTNLQCCHDTAGPRWIKTNLCHRFIGSSQSLFEIICLASNSKNSTLVKQWVVESALESLDVLKLKLMGFSRLPLRDTANDGLGIQFGSKEHFRSSEAVVKPNWLTPRYQISQKDSPISYVFQRLLAASENSRCDVK